jgi:NAD(P)-dependent dehydrogenase (short-subunit alcohol dehydrogenase family)
MHEQLKNRVAVITGGATGIGYAAAQALVESGARVLLAGRDRNRGEEAARTIARGTGRAIFEKADIGRESDVERLFQRAHDAYGRVDFLFNNAATEGPDDDLMPDGPPLDGLVNTNISGVLFCLRHGLPWLAAQGGGVVVNAGSFVGTTHALPHAVAYGATKAAVLSITRSVAVRVAAQHIAVYAVCPWITDTPMVQRLAERRGTTKAQFGAMNPGGRIVTAATVAGAVLSMFGGESGLESGEAVLVDHDGSMQAIVPMMPGALVRPFASPNPM